MLLARGARETVPEAERRTEESQESLLGEERETVTNYWLMRIQTEQTDKLSPRISRETQRKRIKKISQEKK